jgi:hypothetical protein
VNKTRTILLYPQCHSVGERYMKTVEEHPGQVVASHRRDWDARLPTFLLAYRASTHTEGVTTRQLSVRMRTPTALRPASLWHRSTRNDPTIDHAAELVKVCLKGPTHAPVDLSGAPAQVDRSMWMIKRRSYCDLNSPLEHIRKSIRRPVQFCT